MAALLLFPTSAAPHPPLWLPADLVELGEMAAHLLLFTVQALLLRAPFAAPPASSSAVFWITTAYGALLELAQIPVPGRSFEVVDLVVNLLGAGLGLALAARWTRGPGAPG